MIEQSTLYIGGRWTEPSSTDRIDVISPHSEQVVGTVPDSKPADVDTAIAAAQSALHGSWGRTSPEERGEVITRLVAEYAQRADEVARLQVLEMGCPVSQVRPVMVDPRHRNPRLLRRGWRSSHQEQERRVGPHGMTSVVRRKPVGVVGAVIPWNAPSYLSMLKLGPALVSGCTLVLKPAPEAPLSLYPLAEAAIAAGLPAGVLNIVPGGRETGEYLVSHPGIDKVSFTGSVATGRRIAELAGPRFLPTTLELGGKSAAIVLADADLASTVAGLALNCFVNSGQVCGVDSRILLPRARVEEFTAAFVAMVGALKVGDPSEPDTAIGPLVAARQRDRVENYIRTGVAQGARILVGGSRPADQPTGWYIEPTLFDRVSPDMTIAQEEIFGPVVSILAYDSEDEAIEIANGTQYGLAGSVWSTDVDHALAISAGIDTGIVAINGFGCQFSTPLRGREIQRPGTRDGPREPRGVRRVPIRDVAGSRVTVETPAAKPAGSRCPRRG